MPKQKQNRKTEPDGSSDISDLSDLGDPNNLESQEDFPEFDIWEEYETQGEEAAFERFHDPRAPRVKTKTLTALPGILEEKVPKEGPNWTFKPSKKEAEWMEEALKQFFQHPLIDDVLFSVKGGKEASVYCCHTAPDALGLIGSEQVAAKVYRPRMFRSLRNDALYRTGRAVMSGVMKDYMQESRGKQIDRVDARMDRAVKNKTKFGLEVSHTSWMSYEYNTLQTLYDAGASVPRPFSITPNAILMSFTGTKNRGAATLIEVGLDKKEATRLFLEVKRNIKIMATFGFAHGDLSAYNILYHEGDVTIIDFPQVVRFGENPYIEQIVRRDMERICEYFDKQGVSCDPQTLLEEVGYQTLINAYNEDQREMMPEPDEIDEIEEEDD